MLMRGGSSKGPYIDLADLPAEPAQRDRVLLRLMGSPDNRQIDGLGGAEFLTSKLAMVGRSERDGVDVDYLFAQVAIDEPIVDTAPPCGNMLAGVAPFAIETGLIRATHPETRVMIFNVNTNAVIEAVVQTPDGVVDYDGSTVIDGVPGSAAPVLLSFIDAGGRKTGALLPTGRLTEDIDGVEVSCLDSSMPMMLARADSFGLEGDEDAAFFESNASLMARIESMRRIAGQRMGLGDVAGSVVPKVGLLSRAAAGGTIRSRYLTPHTLHAAHAVTGGICVATAACLPGSVASGLVQLGTAAPKHVSIEHPSGKLDLKIEIEGPAGQWKVAKAGVIRTARKIMTGTVFVPESAWEGA